MKSSKGSQAKAWAVSIALHLLLVMIFGLLTLGIPDHPPANSNAGGMALALGTPEGMPDSDPSVSSSPEQTPESSAPDPDPQPNAAKSPPVATQDVEDAPTVPVKSSPPAETKPMDPRLQRLLNRKNSPNPKNEKSPSKGVNNGSADSAGLSSGKGGFSASGDGLENRGFTRNPDPEEFKILDAQVEIPIEVDREGRVRVIGTPKSSKPLTPEQRRALVEATQNARFKPMVTGKDLQRGILKYELKIRSK